MTRGSGINVTGALALICILVGACSLTMAQADREFKDEANGFMITLVGNWRAVPYTDAVGRQKTEFVYENRDQGLLRITRDNLRGSTLHDMVRREMDEFAFCNSCVFAGQEAFAGGSLRGIRVALYYIEGGRRIVGTFYFLQERESVWILRFNGRPGSSGMGHEITDAMARSFCSVGALYYRHSSRKPDADCRVDKPTAMVPQRLHRMCAVSQYQSPRLSNALSCSSKRTDLRWKA